MREISNAWKNHFYFRTRCINRKFESSTFSNIYSNIKYKLLSKLNIMQIWKSERQIIEYYHAAPINKKDLYTFKNKLSRADCVHILALHLDVPRIWSKGILTVFIIVKTQLLNLIIKWLCWSNLPEWCQYLHYNDMEKANLLKKISHLVNILLIHKRQNGEIKFIYNSEI